MARMNDFERFFSVYKNCAKEFGKLDSHFSHEASVATLKEGFEGVKIALKDLMIYKQDKELSDRTTGILICVGPEGVYHLPEIEISDEKPKVIVELKDKEWLDLAKKFIREIARYSPEEASGCKWELENIMNGKCLENDKLIQSNQPKAL